MVALLPCQCPDKAFFSQSHGGCGMQPACSKLNAWPYHPCRTGNSCLLRWALCREEGGSGAPANPGLYREMCTDSGQPWEMAALSCFMHSITNRLPECFHSRPCLQATLPLVKLGFRFNEANTVEPPASAGS